MPSNELPDESEVTANISRMLKSLSPEEQCAILKRLGLEGETAQSPAELAQALHLSAAEIKDIELRALLKLKHPTLVPRQRPAAETREIVRKALHKLRHPSRFTHPRSFVDQE